MLYFVFQVASGQLLKWQVFEWALQGSATAGDPRVAGRIAGHVKASPSGFQGHLHGAGANGAPKLYAPQQMIIFIPGWSWGSSFMNIPSDDHGFMNIAPFTIFS